MIITIELTPNHLGWDVSIDGVSKVVSGVRSQVACDVIRAAVESAIDEEDRRLDKEGDEPDLELANDR